MYPVAILAGGLAARLGRLTEAVPKVLLPVAGRPFISHQLELLKGQGITRVVVCAGRLSEQIVAAVGDGSACGLSVEYSFDGDLPLGTGGAVRRAVPKLGEDFFVVYGDSYLRCSFAEVQAAYDASERPSLMTVLRNEDRWDKSNVLFRNGSLLEYDKRSPSAEMKHIDYGLSVLSSRVFADTRDGIVFDLAELYRALALGGQLAGFEVEKRFLEIGSLEGLREAEEFLSSARLDT